MEEGIKEKPPKRRLRPAIPGGMSLASQKVVPCRNRVVLEVCLRPNTTWYSNLVIRTSPHDLPFLLFLFGSLCVTGCLLYCNPGAVPLLSCLL